MTVLSDLSSSNNPFFLSLGIVDSQTFLTTFGLVVVFVDACIRSMIVSTSFVACAVSKNNHPLEIKILELKFPASNLVLVVRPLK